MATKRTSGAGGSARGKATDFTAKKGSGHKVESEGTEGHGPVKAGRNMGGRGVMGERIEGKRGKREE
jgi:hypothetical protein